MPTRYNKSIEEMARTLRQFHDRIDVRSIVAAINPALQDIQQFQNSSALEAIRQIGKEVQAFKAAVGGPAYKDLLAMIEGPDVASIRELVNSPAIEEMRKLQEDIRSMADISGVRSLLELQRQTQLDIAEMMRSIEFGPHVQAAQGLQPVYDAVADLEGQWELLDQEPDSDEERQKRRHFLKELNSCLDALDEWVQKHPFRSDLLWVFVKGILPRLLLYFAVLASIGDVASKELQKTEDKLRHVWDVCIRMQAKYLTVRSLSAPVRAKGNGGGEILFHAKNGDTFCELQRTEHWVLVQSSELGGAGPSNARIGWIRKVYLKPAE